MRYAVIRTGGKQYRVTVGQRLPVEMLTGAEGDLLQFDAVLMVGEGAEVQTGTPLVAGARVLASLSRHERGPKLRVFRYKSKKRVRVLRGHRQSLTLITIRDILLAGENPAPLEAKAEQTLVGSGAMSTTEEPSSTPETRPAAGPDESEGTN